MTKVKKVNGPATPRAQRLAARAAAAGAALVLVTVSSAVFASAAFAANIPNPSPISPPGADAKMNTILGIGMWLVIGACVAGVFICAGKLALAHRRGESGEVAGQLGGVAGACVLVASASALVGFLVN